ncbi:zinc finger and SCAN domain-containing protein 5B-like [Loxodonta africana]|uniref:zinc finger and SCAN domain-containing protein 5B-like n=1 Tax=Loxodonta africana TaxID=9785 RepID=UPI0030CE6A74
MAADLTSSWSHGKPGDNPGSEPPQFVSSQGTDLGEKDCNHVNFRAFTCLDEADPIRDLKRLCELCRLWLRPDLHTKEQLLGKLVLEQFMISMPLDLQVLVKEGGVENCKDLKEMLRNIRRPKTWGQKLLPETISPNGEPESLRPGQNLENNLMEDTKGSTVCDAQEPQLLKGPADSVGANDGKDREEGTSIKNVGADTPPTLVLEREVSTPGGNREDSQKNLRCSKRRKPDNSSSSQVGPHEGATHLDKREFLAQIGLYPVDLLRTMGQVDHDSTSAMGPTDHAVGQDQEPTGHSPYQCRFCKKRFHYKSQLDIHQRTHTGERPFKCSSCGKGFLQPSDVRVHQRIHTGEKPFKCELCHKEFTHESSLYGHKRIHTNERPFLCTECGKHFNHKGNLSIHRRIHTGEKLFKCELCHREFTQESTLYGHKWVHTNERPFHCTECGKRFKHKGNLNVHQRIHAGTKPYTCPQCGHSFRQLGTFKCHKKMHLQVTYQ